MYLQEITHELNTVYILDTSITFSENLNRVIPKMKEINDFSLTYFVK